MDLGKKGGQEWGTGRKADWGKDVLHERGRKKKEQKADAYHILNSSWCMY